MPRYASIWIRIWAAFLDYLIVGVLAFALKKFPLIQSLLYIAYDIFFIGKYGQTPGMRVAKLHVLATNCTSLRWGPVILRSVLINSSYFISLIYPTPTVTGSTWEILRASLVPAFVGVYVYMAQILCALLDPKKRMLHDVIAGSVVVQNYNAAKVTPIVPSIKNSLLKNILIIVTIGLITTALRFFFVKVVNYVTTEDQKYAQLMDGLMACLSQKAAKECAPKAHSLEQLNTNVESLRALGPRLSAVVTEFETKAKSEQVPFEQLFITTTAQYAKAKGVIEKVVYFTEPGGSLTLHKLEIQTPNAIIKLPVGAFTRFTIQNIVQKLNDLSAKDPQVRQRSIELVMEPTVFPPASDLRDAWSALDAERTIAAVASGSPVSELTKALFVQQMRSIASKSTWQKTVRPLVTKNQPRTIWGDAMVEEMQAVFAPAPPKGTHDDVAYSSLVRNVLSQTAPTKTDGYRTALRLIGRQKLSLALKNIGSSELPPHELGILQRFMLGKGADLAGTVDTLRSLLDIRDANEVALTLRNLGPNQGRVKLPTEFRRISAIYLYVSSALMDAGFVNTHIHVHADAFLRTTSSLADDPASIESMKTALDQIKVADPTVIK